MLVGGIAAQFRRHGRAIASGSGRDFVIEGDEYDSAFFDKTAKFLKYLPDIAVVNNVEFDHADIYPDLDAVTLAFRRLVTSCPGAGLLFARRRQPERALALKAAAVSRVETFGFSGRRDWLAHDLQPSRGVTFTVRMATAAVGDLRAAAARRHNVRNALAAIAVATDVGHRRETIADGPRELRGREAAAGDRAASPVA